MHTVQFVLEQIILEAMENSEGTVSVAGQKVSNLRFADDIDLIAGNSEELSNITERLDSITRKYGMEISSEKSKIMVTSRQNSEESDTDIKVGGERLSTVETFKYLGSTLNENMTSQNEITTRLAIATSQLAKLSNIWNSKKIKVKTKIKLMHALITSVVLYGCESWTLNKRLEERLNAFEMRCFRRILGVSYRDHRTNTSVIQEVTEKAGSFERLLEKARRRKLQWFGHVTRRPGTLAHSIMHGSVEGTRKRGRPKTNWLGDIQRWTGKKITECIRLADDRAGWKREVNAAKCPNGFTTMGVT